MLSIYDLYDLHSIFTCIRFRPDYELNGLIMSKASEVLNNRYSNSECNQFRIAIRSIDNLDYELYRFSSTDNVYTYFPSLLKDEKIYILLVESCECLSEAINDGNKEKIIDLADCLHNLPIIIVENNHSIPKHYWENEVKYYRKKWDNDFLRKIQKSLSRGFSLFS